MQTSETALVVSIHDVSPWTREPVDRMMTELKECGVGRISLLVIPDHHRRGRISQNAGFSEWLRAKVADGHEAVAHGFYHLRESRTADGAWKRLVTESYTAGEGEFYDLTFEEALRRLEEAKSEFAACGISPKGFIAPAWLLGEDAERAVKAAGFGYTTRIGTVVDLTKGVTHRSQSVVYSVRAPWRRACSLAWGSLLYQGIKSNPLLRVGLHPPDWEHAAIRSHALRILRAALAGRKAFTYQEWVQ